MRESSTATFHEIMKSGASVVLAHESVGIVLNKIIGHHDVTAENQDIGTLIVVKVQVSKLKV
jgi:hypothetical protein